ncbi:MULTISPECIES: BPL-N domain-containing protein [unclassified Nocardia]|uniref:BPL-N domain-containing protein n=1 Tax=unclassified Nocardia TaxID=2637762 RepID=UPI001CE3FDB7|nr:MULTISPECIES: BPL-N domain-containing protein [unclassified Nocardia]
MIRRRTFLIATAAVTGTAAAGGAAVYETYRHREPDPLALVYRGPASKPGCPEAVAALLSSTATALRVAYVGPREQLPLTAETLSSATIFAQPGGGEVEDAWPSLRAHAEPVRDWVRAGGIYLGFCLGAYLAGKLGYRLLDGHVDQYISTPHAIVTSTRDTVIPIDWRDRRYRLFFQDGPAFRLNAAAPALRLATYTTGEPAALVTTCGKGQLGLVGPHPEADKTWFQPPELSPEGAIHPELGHDLIESALTPLQSAPPV